MNKMQVAVCSLLALAVLSPVQGDLGAAVRKARQAPAVLPAAAPLTGPLVVPLRRESARGVGRERETSIYVGKVSLGQPPQLMSVTFDTASGMVILPHRACRNASCLEHRRYSPWESSTAMDSNVNGEAIEGVHGRLAQGVHLRDVVTVGFTQADLGEGFVSGIYVRDGICVAGQQANQEACLDLAALVATSMAETPFRSMPSDGIVGLGLEGLSTGHMSSFLGRLFEGSVNALPQFGLALLGGDRGGELHLGGHDAAHLAAPLRWFPVAQPEDGYWQVAIRAVRVGNRTVDACRQGCHGIVDSGTSSLGVQATRLPSLLRALRADLVQSTCRGADLTFDLGGMQLVLGAKDYTSADCDVRLGALDLPEAEYHGVYALGGALLHRYYAAFDWEQKRLGFAPLARSSEATGRSSPQELPGVLLV